MENLTKTRPPIVTDLILKQKIAENLAEELNISEATMNEYSWLFIDYAEVVLKLQNYQSVIPKEELETYNKLRYQEAKIYLQIKELSGEPILELDYDALEDETLGVCHG